MSNNLDLKTAVSILKEYSCIETKLVTSPEEKEKLCQAIILVTSLSNSENIGICANNVQEGYKALKSYLKALDYNDDIELKNPDLENPVYLKFNTAKNSHFVDSYDGNYRGVLISCQSEDDNIAGTYGYFPLDLFI